MSKNKILIIGPSWLGDSVISCTMIYLLKKQKHTQIDIITPKWCQSLFNKIPEIHQTIASPIQHNIIKLREIYKFSKNLRYKNYQQAIILPNSFKSALIPLFAKIPKRTGWKGEIRYGIINDLRILNKKLFPLMVQRYAALAFDSKTVRNANELPKPLPWPKLIIQTKNIKNILQHFKINNNNRPIIGICPGTGSNPLKCWPHYHYATLILNLINYGYQVMLIGHYTDYQIGIKINNLIPKIKTTQKYYHNFIGHTSLNQAITLIAGCTAIISNDSGLMHIASALQRPTIGLFGPSNPNFTPPLSHYATYIINDNNQQKKINNNKIKHTYHPKLINLKPIQVLQKLKQLIE